MANKLAKVVYAVINGQYYRCKHDARHDMGGENAEAQPGDGKPFVGVSSEPVPATFSFTLLKANDLDLVELRQLQAMSIDFRYDDGSVYRIGDAYWSSPPDSQNGEVSCEGFGKPAKKVA
jgi:hypothetical protein